MDLRLTLTHDERGFHLADAISSTTLHFTGTAEIDAYLTQVDGTPLEQALRGALREIVAQQAKTASKLDAAVVVSKDFTFQPAKAVTTWP